MARVSFSRFDARFAGLFVTGFVKDPKAWIGLPPSPLCKVVAVTGVMGIYFLTDRVEL